MCALEEEAVFLWKVQLEEVKVASSHIVEIRVVVVNPGIVLESHDVREV